METTEDWMLGYVSALRIAHYDLCLSLEQQRFIGNCMWARASKAIRLDREQFVQGFLHGYFDASDSVGIVVVTIIEEGEHASESNGS